MSPGTQASTSQKQLSSMDIIKRRRNCSRLLFGVPDRNELDEWLNRNADRHATEAKSKWNFDFEKGVPLNTSGQSSSSSTFEYERVEGVEVPKFYRTRPARQKLLRLRTNQFETNSNSSAEHPKEPLKRAESTPIIGTTKTVSRTLKKVVSQAMRRDNGHVKKPKTTNKSPKKKSPTKNKPKSKKFEHALPTTVF